MKLNSRGITGLGGLVVIATWAGIGTGAEPEASRSGMAERMVATSGVESLERTMHQQHERLRRRLDSAPRPQVVRNPFEFAAPHQAGVSHGPAQRPPVPSAVASQQGESEPELVLLGMAVTERGGARIRTAIIGGSGEALWIVEEGHPLDLRYRVTRIAEASAELTDVRTGRTRQLLLRGFAER